MPRSPRMGRGGYRWIMAGLRPMLQLSPKPHQGDTRCLHCETGEILLPAFQAAAVGSDPVLALPHYREMHRQFQLPISIANFNCLQ